MPGPLTVTTPNDTDIRVERVFDAPARLVFDCHTQPAYVQRWMLGPPGWSMPVCEIDLRVGGRYRYVWRSDAGDGEFSFVGEFKEIAAPHRLVHSESMVGMDGEAIITSDFVETGGRTTLIAVMRFPTKEARDGALATGMTDGMEQSYGRLDAIAARAAA